MEGLKCIDPLYESNVLRRVGCLAGRRDCLPVRGKQEARRLGTGRHLRLRACQRHHRALGLYAASIL